MNREMILEHIAASMDVEECEAISKAAHARARELYAKQFKARVADFWKRTAFWKTGQTLYCGASGTFIGGAMQRGDKGVVYKIQPRRRILWLTIGKRRVGFNDVEVCRYHLQPEPPENNISASERAIADRLARVL